MKGDAREDTAPLVARALGGDAEAIDRLVRMHLGPAYAVALAVTGDPADAEDVVQEAMVVALQRLAECRKPERFSAWLLQIVRNRARNHRRYEGIRTSLPLDVAESRAAPGSPARDAENSELRGRLADGLSTLPPVRREVLLLHDLEGWKHREIAESLGLPEGTVRHHLFHARRAMRAQLGTLVREED